MGKQATLFAIEDDYQFLLQAAEEIGMRAIPELTDVKEYDRLGYVESTEPLEYHHRPTN